MFFFRKSLNIGNQTKKVAKKILGVALKQKINMYKYVHMNVKLKYHNSEYIFGKLYIHFFIIISHGNVFILLIAIHSEVALS